MDPRFFKRDPNDPEKIVGWRYYGEACELIGQENMDKPNKAGLMVIATEEAIKQVFGDVQR